MKIIYPSKLTLLQSIQIPGVTLDSNLSSEIEIFIVGSGISSDKPDPVKEAIIIAEHHYKILITQD